MEYLFIGAAFLQAILFKLWDLKIKKIQDKGADTLTVLHYQKYALIPALCLLIITYEPEYLQALISNKLVLIAFFYSAAIWLLHQYIAIYIQGAVSSMIFLNAFRAIIVLPMGLLFGYWFNGDSANIGIMIALFLLAIALYIQPQQKQESKQIFTISIIGAILLSILGTALDISNLAAYRYALQNIEATMFLIALALVTGMSIVWIYCAFRYNTYKQKLPIIDTPFWFLISIPTVWFIASIPEGFSYSEIPVYVVVIFSAVTFFMDLFSDLKNKRIQPSARTILFSLLILSSIGLSIIYL